jgi:hypothetical protein
LFEIKARKKFDRKHMVDISRIKFFYATPISGKLAIYGWTQVRLDLIAAPRWRQDSPLQAGDLQR